MLANIRQILQLVSSGAGLQWFGTVFRGLIPETCAKRNFLVLI